MLTFLPTILAATALAATNAAPIRTVADAMKLSAFDGLGPWPFVLEGQVYSNRRGEQKERPDVREFWDATGGYPFEDHRRSGEKPSLGDVVRISGEMTITPDDLRHLQVREMEILGSKPLPPPVCMTDDSMDDPAIEYSFVRVRGVVTAVVQDDLDTEYRRLILKTRRRSVEIAVSCSTVPHAALRALLDAEVEASGLYTRKAGWRRNIGMHVLLSDSRNLKVLVPPPDDPFAAPELHDEDSQHRRRTSGMVVAASRGRFFLTTRTGRFLEVNVSEESAVPKAGDSVETAGFTEMDPFLLRLSEAVVRPADTNFPAPTPPQIVDLAKLFSYTNGTARIDTSKHGHLIRFTGTVSDLAVGASPEIFFVQRGGHGASVDVSGISGAPRMPEHGSEVEITGLCLAKFTDDMAHRSIPRFSRYVVMPRSPDDIRILKRPPWWTPARLLLVIALLALALVAVLIWNRTLRVLSERRGRQLYREELGRALAEKKTEERARLAVELHDSISQTLTGVAMQVDAAFQADAIRPGSAKPFLDAAKTLLASCRHELRCCIWDLRSRTFEEKDIAEAIVRTVRPHIGDIDLCVRFSAPRRDLSESTVHAILRIVRELSVNAIRHGGATSIRIDGECRGSTIRFSVVDNGCGFVPGGVAAAKSGHFGLQGIRERLKNFDGALEIESSPGAGTKATVAMDVPELRETT